MYSGRLPSFLRESVYTDTGAAITARQSCTFANSVAKLPLQDLKIHERRKSNQLYLTCGVCGFKLDDTTNLSDQISTRHRGMTRHKCLQCRSAVKFKSGLSRHVKAKHT
ncbi:PR domain zinc finger protein 13-like [Mya arenaria]|uniref:PR domain zinc finger protein 13-like n=1 Tax=Mya arenaria TaxID=6604 RepID=UPI0022E37623|nr:PR domain zinc finger protein 13-like [Mya arenaria]